ncbi:MAG: preprotein translocase subunit SecY [Chitinispirillaceae bacterium]
MLETFQNIFRIPDLRKRIFFTLLVIFIYRIGGHVPTPGVNAEVLREFFADNQGGLFGLYDMFVGGSFRRFTVFALGIMPYITSSIIIQLMGTVFPYFHKLQREGAEGRKKITQYTRYGTVIIGLVQAVGIGIFISNVQQGGISAVLPQMQGFLFMFTTAVSLTTGTVLTMWLGEQITSRGLGNGISLIIFIGIVAQLPGGVYAQVQQVMADTSHLLIALLILAIVLAMTVFIVIMTQAMRRIPIQTPKKVVGTKMYAGQNTVLPLKLNMAGVIPIIFASSIMTFPGMIKNFMPDSATLDEMFRFFEPGSILYSLIYAVLIIFFTYFYTAIVFNPIDIADNLKRQGGFIPGIRPGKKTAEFLDNVLARITLPGSVFLAIIAVLPLMIMRGLGQNFYFGGTSILIVVGVALDTLQQLESHLQMRNYEGFMKKGRLRGRRY